MLRIFAIFGLFYFVYGDLQPLIFGGEKVTDNRYSFMVFIDYCGNDCSGSIIDEKWVLTAAHCFEPIPNPENVTLIVGLPNNLQVKNSVKKIYIHENYNFKDESAYDDDIALVELDVPFDLNENISTVEYWKGQTGITDCSILGFGYTENHSPGELYEISNIVILSPEECRPSYRPSFNTNFVCIFDRGRGICPGDSGGPLLCQGKIYAVSVRTTAKIQGGVCTSPGESYFLKVCPYNDWIEEKIFGYKKPVIVPNYNVLIGAIAIVLVVVLSGIALFLIKYRIGLCRMKNEPMNVEYNARRYLVLKDDEYEKF